MAEKPGGRVETPTCHRENFDDRIHKMYFCQAALPGGYLQDETEEIEKGEIIYVRTFKDLLNIKQ